MQSFRTASTLTASNCRWLAAVGFLIRGEHFPKITRENLFLDFSGPIMDLQQHCKVQLFLLYFLLLFLHQVKVEMVESMVTIVNVMVMMIVIDIHDLFTKDSSHFSPRAIPASS